jgi:hypothetical protein
MNQPTVKPMNDDDPKPMSDPETRRLADEAFHEALADDPFARVVFEACLEGIPGETSSRRDPVTCL